MIKDNTHNQLDKVALNNNTKPAPVEDCYFSHSAEQMAAHNRNIMLKRKKNIFTQQNKVLRSMLLSNVFSGTTSSTQMEDQLLFFVSRFDLYATKNTFCDSLVRLLSSANGSRSLNNVQASCLS